MNDIYKNIVVKIVLILFLIITATAFIYMAINRNDLFAIILSSIYGLFVLTISVLMIASKFKKSNKNK